MAPIFLRNRRTRAVLITCAICWVCAFVNLKVFPSYSFGLFIWLPLVLGALSTIFYYQHNAVTKRQCFNTTIITLVVFCFGLITFAFEGIICIIMAAPIGFFFSGIGHLIGYQIVKTKTISPSVISMVLVVSMPVISGFEYYNPTGHDQLRPVVTTIVINAPPEKVWANVIAFPQLAEPTELLFKAGIAYPINATIYGNGVGAVRHCNFSTGSFVEPITTWDKPNLLKFSVDEQPETMKEISFYDLHPDHLHGYFVSKHGQFKLTRLAHGRTLLEGTTWYYNKITPAVYWNVWSDFIVHKIHKRVLGHIKTEAEKG